MQLLQLVHGRHDEAVRSPNTLEALAALAADGYVVEGDAARLDDSYRFLRTVEHRLQLYDEQQTHTIPVDVQARTRLARVLGYRDGPRGDALEAVRGRPPRATGGGALDPRAPLLRADSRRAGGDQWCTVARSRGGTPGRLRVHRRRADPRRGARARVRVHPPFSADAAAPSRDPGVAVGDPRPRPRPPPAPAPGRGLGALRPAVRHVPRLAGCRRAHVPPARVEPPRSAKPCAASPSSSTRSPTTPCSPSRGRAPSSWPMRSTRSNGATTRNGARTGCGGSSVASSCASRRATSSASRRSRRSNSELTALAEACLEGALACLEPPMPFAVIGMGRLGGAELSYASDIDVLFVYDGDSPGDFDAAEHIATLLVQEIGATTAGGPDLPHRHPAPARGQPGPTGAFARRVRVVLRALRAHVGAPGPLEGAVRRGLGRGRRAVLRARRPNRVRPAVHR